MLLCRVSDFNPLFRLAAGLPDNLTQTLTSNNFVPQFRGFDIFGPAVVGPSQIQQAGIDINQRTSYSLQWTFTVQRELPSKHGVRSRLLAIAGTQAGAKRPAEQRAGRTGRGRSRAVPTRLCSMRPAPSSRPTSMWSATAFRWASSTTCRTPRSRTITRCSCALEKPFTERAFLADLLHLLQGDHATRRSSATRAASTAARIRPPQDSFNLRAERGLASFDTRQRLVNTVVYQLPFGRNQKFLRYGVRVEGSRRMGDFRHRHGAIRLPLHPNLRGDTAGVGAGTGGIFVRPNLRSGCRLAAAWRSAEHQRFFNTAAFAAPAAGTFGNVGRNTLIGPGFVNADAVVARHFRVKEGLDLQFRAEFFNTLNHPNFNLVGRILNDPTFGQVLSQFDPRQLQFGLKLTF